MILIGLLTTVLGFLITLMSLGLTQAVGLWLAMVIAGIAVSLFRHSWTHQSCVSAECHLEKGIGGRQS